MNALAEHPFVRHIEKTEFSVLYGRVKKIGLTHIEADGPAAAIGDIVNIECGADCLAAPLLVPAEVVGVEEGKVSLMALKPSSAIRLNARVLTRGTPEIDIGVGNRFAGRAVNALGEAIDDQGPIMADRFASRDMVNPLPLERVALKSRFDTGIAGIDGLLTLARGQRIGIFAAAGVGKTTLIEQLASQAEYDRCVICLIGERGREVEAFWQNCQASRHPERFTLVASTSDESAALRARAGNYALCLADYWRRKGEHVLLIVDSVTRMAMAMREIGLAAGEPPTVRAYTPSVFAAIPRFVEHCGAIRSGGAITAVMTILSETDDVDDPIAEMMKSLLDGHIILSRQIAEQGHFPAIDISRSVSRQAGKLMSAEHLDSATEIRKLLSVYDESRTLVESGIYKAGSNAQLDNAIRLRPAIMKFLMQPQNEKVAFEDCVCQLEQIATGVRV